MENASAARIDPIVTELFDSSLGPVKSYDKKSIARHRPHKPESLLLKNDSKSASAATFDFPHENENENLDSLTNRRGRKRKRDFGKDDMEAFHLQRLARREVKEDARGPRTPHNIRRSASEAAEISTSALPLDSDPHFVHQGEDSEAEDRTSDDATGNLQHESVVASIRKIEVEKASRTVFLGNVSTMAIKSKSAKKMLLDHLRSPVSQRKGRGAKHVIESIRFRSTPFSDARLPRKAAFAKKELMDSTAKSTNAYAVYVSQAAARAAVESLNGTVVLDRHLRVDSVAHPASQDHRRCIFVGNLGFVDDDSTIKEIERESRRKEKSRKSKGPADYEEGLWRTFMQVGKVESVRFIRDQTTRIGKGFAYVQFYDANSVEAALIFNNKKYPPMLPRKLRVVRAKSSKKPASGEKSYQQLGHRSANPDISRSKASSLVPTISGRAQKLLGRAGAAQLKVKDDHGRIDMMKTPGTFIFEGHRASRSSQKTSSTTRKRAKPQNRSSRRGADFKRRKSQG